MNRAVNKPRARPLPAKDIKKTVKKVGSVSGRDVITRLARDNFTIILRQIFITLSPGDLTAARQVCRAWHQYSSQVFWVDKVARKMLHNRLERNWEEERHRRVELEITGAACRENCSLNYRCCDCPLLCQVAQNCLVLVWGATKVQGTYRVNDGTETSLQHDFDHPQYQVRLSMKQDLELDTSNFLWKPIFQKKQTKKTKLVQDNVILEVDNKDHTILVISDKTSRQTIRRIQPYTGWGDLKPITAMTASSGRLALLISGRVFVFSLTKMIRGCSTDECLLLVGTRQSQHPVQFVHLGPHCLLTVGGGTLVLFNFWSDRCSTVSEFFT